MNARHYPLLLAVSALLFTVCGVRAQAPSEISYQGLLEEDGAPVDDPNATLTFRLYDGSNTAVWTETQTGVAISGGLFDVLLGAVTPFVGNEFDEPLDLEVEYGGTALAPRTPLSATPYALGLHLPLIAETSTTSASLHIRNTSTSSGGIGIWGDTSAPFGRGVHGLARSTSGAAYGVHGVTESPNGCAVYGKLEEGAFNVGPYGCLGGRDSGAYGEHDNGPLGSLGNEFTGAHASHPNGNTAELAGILFGVQAATTAGNPAVFEALGNNAFSLVKLVGNDATLDLIEARIGTQKQFEVDGDGTVHIFDLGEERIRLDNDEGFDAPAIKLFRGGVTVLELDADHNGDSRVITQELEITGGSDLAEHFDVATPDGLGLPAPGTVVSIDPEHPGRLVVSGAAYDPLVAGVVSGAGGVETGLLLRQEGSIADGDVPVALVGRVYVRADATHGPIRPGDLLTTSPTPGHAMRAADPARAVGAVLGKAMTGLDTGTGLVLVLVSLQ